MFQRFRFTDAGERLSHNFLDQLVDALNRALVLLLPVQVVIPGCLGKYQLHKPPISPRLDRGGWLGQLSLGTLAGTQLLNGCHQPFGVGWAAKQVCRFL